MLAIVAAILFGLALILDLANANLGGTIGLDTIVIAGLLCLALHLGGVGTAMAGRGRGWYSSRRRRT
jgi:hypothetical protein